jgi:hypothetical protein
MSFSIASGTADLYDGAVVAADGLSFDGSSYALINTAGMLDHLGVYTIEFEVSPNGTINNAGLMWLSTWGAGPRQMMYFDNRWGWSWITVLQGAINGEYDFRENVSRSMPAGFSHVAFVCDTTTVKVYVNGVLKNTYTDMSQHLGFSDYIWRFGADYGSWQGPLNGKLRNVRFSRSIRYSGPFTPPASLPAFDIETLFRASFLNDASFQYMCV